MTNQFKCAAPQPAVLSSYDACATIEGFDGRESTEEEVIEAFQFLIDTGIVWQLQGFYGRNAANLIEQGVCTPRGG